MNFAKYRCLILLFVLTFVGFSACKPSNPFIYTPISGAIIIDSNEQRIGFDKYFKPEKQVNELCFEYPEAVKIDPDSTMMTPPKFADGTPLLITSYLIDQNGNKYEITKITRLTENYICFVPENYGAWLEISKQNVTFVELYTRSNRKIDILKIEWKSYNAWDMK